MRKHFNNFLVCCTLIIFCYISVIASYAQITSGKNLFKQNCSMCHSLDIKIVGPPLLKINERREYEWLISYIEDENKLRNSGDSIAIKLFAEYRIGHPAYSTDLSKREVKRIIKYLAQESYNK